MKELAYSSLGRLIVAVSVSGMMGIAFQDFEWEVFDNLFGECDESRGQVSI